MWLLTRSVVFRALRVAAGVRTSRMLLGPRKYSTGQADRVSVPTRLAVDLGFPVAAVSVDGYLFEDLFLSLRGITVPCGYSVFNC